MAGNTEYFFQRPCAVDVECCNRESDFELFIKRGLIKLHA